LGKINQQTKEKNNIKMEKTTVSEPIHVTDAEFDKMVLKSTLPVIVDFWAPWCGPCRMVAPILDKIAKEQDGKLVVAKVNTDESSEWASKYGVQGIPTMLFIAGGKVIQTQVGALPEAMLKQIVDQFLEKVAVAN
jgi:thioredoxin 1